MTGRHDSRGFTLVELMVAMGLLAMLSIGMLTTVNVIGRTQRATSSVDTAQAAARACLEMITRNVEMAAAGARAGAINYANGTPPVRLALRVVDSNAGTDRLEVISIDTTAQATLMAGLTTAGQTNILVSSSAGFAAGNLLQVSDLVTPWVLQVTGTAPSGGNPALQVLAGTNPLPQVYPAGSYAFRARATSYYVDTAAFGPTNPLLMLDPDGPGPLPGQPLAEGVEDLQVALGFDTNGDGALTNVGTVANDDEWVYNVAGETAPADLSLLRAVRVTLVVRTVQVQSGTRGRRPAAENHAAATAADGFSRRVLRSEITVRNFNL